MQIITHKTAPIEGQIPGTSGLRKTVSVFAKPGYLETYTQSIFNAIDVTGATLIMGGDGRYFNREAIATILKIAAANSVERVIVGCGGILSTPAASHLIRKRNAHGGLILSASHNPGGPDGDFGLKYNIDNGGPAPEKITQKIVECAQNIDAYHMLDAADPALERLGESKLGKMIIEVIDPVEDYAALMEQLFDFNAIKAMFEKGFTMSFDAMHAVTGPYAIEIFEKRLGAHAGTVMNFVPREDFGKGHPDPNPVWAKPLYDLMLGPDAPEFGAASDGDGDRNMIMGRGIYITPSDSLAVLANNAHLAPAYSGGINGIARSMPTSQASDRVAEKLGVEAFQTPTGWKYFGTLLDAGRATLCGEESAGTGSDHIREKDGLWAVLLWLNILAVRGETVQNIMDSHWATFGRDYYSRHDYEALELQTAQTLMGTLTDKLSTLSGQKAGKMGVKDAKSFSYTDPIDGSVSHNQGLIITYDQDARAMLRLSGTGTQGATLRIYLEQYEAPAGDHDQDAQIALKDVIEATNSICKLQQLTGRTQPDVIS